MSSSERVNESKRFCFSLFTEMSFSQKMASLTSRLENVISDVDRKRDVVLGWLRLVGSFNLDVSFAEYGLCHRALLQKRPKIWRSLLIVATTFLFVQRRLFLCLFPSLSVPLCMWHFIHAARWGRRRRRNRNETCTEEDRDSRNATHTEGGREKTYSLCFSTT